MLHVAAAEATTGDCAGAMREKASRWTKGLAKVVDGQVAHVEVHRAMSALRLDHDRDRAPLDALAERQLTTAGEPTVREPLQHSGIILQQ